MKALRGFVFIVLCAAAIVGGAAGWKALHATKPLPIKNYSLLFLPSGEKAELGAQEVVVQGSCVIFKREGKQILFCNLGMVVLPGVVPPSEESSNGPTQLTPDDNLSAAQ